MAVLYSSNHIPSVFDSKHATEMDAQNFSCFPNNNNNNNNNNYVAGFTSPGLLPYLTPSMTFHNTCMPTMPLSIYQTSPIGQATNFTFTSPTQGNIISHAAPLYTAPISSVPGPPQQSHIVPGIGAQWQHTVPQNMPWAVVSQGQTHVTEFTAQSLPSYNPMLSQHEPRASCSFTQRRPKRHFQENDVGVAPSSKVRISDELMMARMKGLHITAPEFSKNTPSSLSVSSWQKLRDLEERLEDEPVDIDSKPIDISERNHAHKSLPRLRLKAGFSPQDLLKPSPILPKTIIEDLNKPCMEVVLWKPPDIVRNIEDLTEKPTSLNLESPTEDRCLPTRPPQHSVTSVTPSVPSLSYGDKCVGELQPSYYGMESMVCDDDDMDL